MIHFTFMLLLFGFLKLGRYLIMKFNAVALIVGFIIGLIIGGKICL